MKFDKETILMIAICLTVFFGWRPVATYLGWIDAPQPATATQPQTTAPGAVAANKEEQAAVNPQKIQDFIAVNPWYEAPSNLAKVPTTLKSECMAISFDPVTGAAEKIEMLGYKTDDFAGNIVLDNNAKCAADSPIQPGALALFGDSPWKLSAIVDNSLIDGSYLLKRNLQTADGQPFEVTQRFTISGDYKIDYNVAIRNLSSSPLTFKTLTISGGDLPKWSFISGDSERRGETHSLDYAMTNGKFKSVDVDDDDEDFFMEPVPEVTWCALSNKYFALVLEGDKPFKLFRNRLKVDEEKYALGAMGGSYDNVTIAPSASIDYSFSYYAGPKIVSHLEAFNGETLDLMHLGWGPIGFLAHWTLVFLVWMHSMTGSYGWSIIIMTLLMRLILLPFTIKANNSMRRMQSMQPKIKELKAQYKDQPQVMNQKMMELYREEKINPLGGCLPLLLQMPIFFALLATLEGAVELRHVGFLWATDLAAPDTIAHIFGLPINPLIIVWTLLFLLQQLLTPTSMEPAQRKMMMAMPLVMLIFLYSLPSGLTLYWTVSQIFSMVQLLWQRHSATVLATQAIEKIKRSYRRKS